MSDDSNTEGPAPLGPHLLLFTEGLGGLATGIPVGAGMGVVLDPTRPEGIQKFVLVEVKRDRLVFRCVCSPKCHAVFTYSLKVTGKHGY